MEMHQLRYFAAVARTGSFTRAAGSCRVAQPSLSQQIRKLEEEVGERLLERGRQRTGLTAAGTLFLPHALAVLETAERGRRAVREMDGEVRGRIVLGVLPTIAPYFLPEVLRRFRERHAAVDWVVQEETTARLLRGIEENEIDAALISDTAADPGLRLETLFREELLLCLPKRHPLVRQARVAAADLRQEKFILMEEGHCLGEQAHEYCRTKGFHPQISCRSVQIATVQALVRAGLGISLIPQMARDRPVPRGLVYRSLDGPKPTRPIVLALPRQRKPSPAVTALAEFLREAEGAAA